MPDPIYEEPLDEELPPVEILEPRLITVPVQIKADDFEALTKLYGDSSAAAAIVGRLVDAFLAQRSWIEAYHVNHLSERELHGRIRGSIEDLLPEG